MADFAKCVKGDKLKSKRYGEVTFLLFDKELSPYPVVCREGNEVARWMANGLYLEADSIPDLSIPPKTKTVKRWVGLTPDKCVSDGFLCKTSVDREYLTREYPHIQDVHEIEFTVTEGGNNA